MSRIKDIVTAVRAHWSKMTLKEKALVVLDAAVDIGSGIISGMVGKRLCDEGKCGRLQGLFVKTTMAGMGMWMGNAARQGYHNMLMNTDILPEEEEEDDD